MLITSYKKEKRKETQLLGSVGRDTMKYGLLQPEKKQKTKTCQCNVFTYMCLNYKQIHEFIDILKLIFHL